MIFSKNILLLLFLYFIQGLPYGFQASFLPVYLRNQGVSLTTLGLFKLLLAPWLCKALWAPLVDKYGSKHQWLLWSIGGLILSSAAGSFVSPNNALGLACVLFSLNVFAATQDIAVDGIAVAILAADELGKGNTAQVVGYKIGSIFGGGVLVWFIDILGWKGLFVALMVLYIEAWMFVYVSPSLREYDLRMQVSAAEGIPTYCLEKDELWNQGANFTGSSDSSSSLFPEQSLRRRQTHEPQVSEEMASTSDDDTLLSAHSMHTKKKLRAKYKAKQEEAISSTSKEHFTMLDRQKEPISFEDPAKEIDSLQSVELKSDQSIETGKANLAKDTTISGSSDHVSREETTNMNTDFLQKEITSQTASVTDNFFSSLKSRHSTGQECANVKNNSESLNENASRSNSQSSISSKQDLESQESIDTSNVENSQRTSEEYMYIADGEDSDTSEHCSKQSVGSSVILDDEDEPDFESLSFLKQLVRVPGTKWMMIMVLAYKLGEQGAIGLFPQFLIDQHVKLSDVTFWKGLMGQGLGIVGSLLGGWLISKFNVPLYLLLQQFCLLRLLPVGGLLIVVSCWTLQLVPAGLLYYIGITLLCLLLLLGGAVTTITFTLMMQCSKVAPTSIQATHYTTLATLEVFGKLVFMSATGWLTELLGYPVMFVAFTLLSGAITPWFNRCPDELKLMSDPTLPVVDFVKIDEDLSEMEDETTVEDHGVKEKVA